MSPGATTTTYDGRLSEWIDIEDAATWDGLLVGNGLSINIWEGFRYDSLFERARQSKLFSRKDAKLFETLGVENFETVLEALTTAIRVGDALGKKRPRERRRHRSIQDALAQAVHGVHVAGGDIPEDSYEDIREELGCYRRVFSTSYDLIVYWATAKGTPPFDGFVDYFWSHDCNAFDEDSITLSEDDSRTRLHFLHGALHLVVANGLTCKRKATFLSLLEHFGRPFQGDDTARPLIITEGNASEKSHNIAENEYLTYCWKQLTQCSSPLVVFGHSLSSQDAHLIAAINEHPSRPLAIGLTDKGRQENRKRQLRIAALFDTEKIYFYDSASHALGDEALSLSSS